MRDYLREALISVALFGSIGVASAQTPAPDKDQAQQPSSTSNQNPKDEKTGTEPKATNPPAPASGVFVNGTLNVPGAPADSGTKPSKFSPANSLLDKTPIMARGPVLSDAQRKLIWERVTAESAAPASVSAGPAMELPYTVELHDWPQDVAGQIPGMQDFKYVKTPDKILVVRPENRIVVGEIEVEGPLEPWPPLSRTLVLGGARSGKSRHASPAAVFPLIIP